MNKNPVGSCAVPQTPSITQEVDSLDTRVSNLICAVDALVAKVSPIQKSPTNNQIKKDSVKPDLSGSSLRNRLNEIGQYVTQCETTINIIVESLDL